MSGRYFYIVGYAYRRIPLTQGKYAIVDPDDYCELAKYKWHVNRDGKMFYASRAFRGKNGKKCHLKMHRQIIIVSDNMFVDHINRKGLDNRKANLRPATATQNSCNRAKYKRPSHCSEYKGVSCNKSKKPWKAQIRVKRKYIHLGTFCDEVSAAKAYDKAAKKYHGQFAVLNFPETKRFVPYRVLSLLRAFLKYIAYFSSRFAVLNFPLSPRRRRPKLFRRVLTFSRTVLFCLFCLLIYLGLSYLDIRICLPLLLTAQPAIRKVAMMAKTLYIIDGHAHIYAAYFAPMTQRLTSPTGEPTKAVYIFTRAILGLIQRQNPDMLAVAMDSKTPTFRSEIYAEYKAHRPPMPDDMPMQINRIEEILDALNIPVLRLDGFEADDVIGTLAKKAAADGYDCLICSKDKDILQLLTSASEGTGAISAFDIKTDTRKDVATMVETMLVTPQQFLDCLALQGDAIDNVPGLPDVGPKTALVWIQKYGSIENLYKHIDEIKGKRGENLRKFKDKLTLSKELVTIDCNVPIQIDYDTLALKEFDKQKLAQIFTELGFNRLLTQLGLAESSPPVQDTSHESRVTPVRRSFSEGGSDGQMKSIKTLSPDYKLIDTQQQFDKFITQLKKQKIFAIDTETTSIHAMRADLVGISFSWKEHAGFYLPVRAPLGQKHLDLETIRQKLAPILADRNIKKIGQNIKYDLLVLQNAGMPAKGIHFDTMVASYCLDAGRKHSLDKMALDFLNYECIPISALIGKGKNQLTFDMVDTAAACEYSAEDADITFQLYNYLKYRLDKEPKLKKLFEEVEMPLVSVLAVMESHGVSLDKKLLKNMSGELTETIKNLTDRIYELAGEVFNIDSPKQLAEILFDKLNLESIRIGKAGRSTDVSVLEQLADQHPVIPLIIEYRMVSKLKNTYVDKLGLLINPRTSRVHASFNQTVTSTGRLSSSDPNLQNIPIRTELGRKIRSAFVPKNKKDCILSADYSQIELRLLAHFSKDKALMAAFAADQDIHRFVASQIYNVTIDDVTDQMRSNCKAVNFGIIYGQGAFGLSHSIGISQAEAKKFIDGYFARYSSIRKFMDDCVENAKRTGYAETILHRRRTISNLTAKNANKRAQARRLAINTVVQGSAADLIKVAMINIQRKIRAENLPVKLILQVHDELVFELPADEADKHAKWIDKEMATAIKLDVPLKVDISYGQTWLG